MRLASDYDALVMALVLAVTAPSERAAASCTRQAARLSAGLTPSLVRKAQLEAERLLEANR